MVETSFKSKKELIEAIKEITDNVRKDGNINAFNRGISYINNDIEFNVSSVLYEDFKREKRCVYYESIYGDGQYTDYVIDDCVNVLKTIVETLTFLENE
jgi:hypothetical protein